MTKKSDTRLAKDAEKKRQGEQLKKENRKGWDEVNIVSDGCMAMLATPATFKDCLRDHALMSHLTKEEGVECANSVRLLEKDMMTMLEKFKVIRGKHIGKTGAEKDFAEVMVGYELVNEYMHWKAEFEAFIVPTQGDILQHISNAERRQMDLYTKQQAEKAAAATTTETATA